MRSFIRLIALFLGVGFSAHATEPVPEPQGVKRQHHQVSFLKAPTEASPLKIMKSEDTDPEQVIECQFNVHSNRVERLILPRWALVPDILRKVRDIPTPEPTAVLLPQELWGSIFYHLGYADIFALGATCKTFLSIMQAELRLIFPKHLMERQLCQGFATGLKSLYDGPYATFDDLSPEISAIYHTITHYFFFSAKHMPGKGISALLDRSKYREFLGAYSKPYRGFTVPDHLSGHYLLNAPSATFQSFSELIKFFCQQRYDGQDKLCLLDQWDRHLLCLNIEEGVNDTGASHHDAFAGDTSYVKGYLEVYLCNCPFIPRVINIFKPLRTLKLLGNKMSMHLPSELGLLENLESLTIDQADLLGALPHSFGRLNKLKYLSLTANRFFRIPPILRKLPNLVSLDLDGNPLHTSAVADLAFLPASLKSLSLCAAGWDDEKIDFLDSAAIPSLKRLTRLEHLGINFREWADLTTCPVTLQSLYLDLEQNVAAQKEFSESLPAKLCENFDAVLSQNVTFVDVEGQGSSYEFRRTGEDGQGPFRVAKGEPVGFFVN